MKLEDASETYQKTLTRLAMATFVAQADNEVVAAERKALQDIIADAAPNLNEGEAERLIANQKWLLEVPPNFSLLKRRVSAADTETKETLKRIALVMASADNVIQPEEVRSIEKIYSALGLETASLYSDLHATSTSDELVPVRPAQEAVQGEPIAEELESSSPSVGLKLNKDLIRTKQAQTAEVSQLLQGIFSDSESDEDGEELEPVKEDIFAKLDSKHKTFLRVLIERSRWSEQDYDDLANRFQLLPSGALETINEWAFDTFEDELIETYDGYEMNVELADIIETKIAEGGL
jgi:tellurite resistance protein